MPRNDNCEVSRLRLRDITIRARVLEAVREARITDIHTHLFSNNFPQLLLRGIDDLLTYHYLAAETLRWGVISPDGFWKRSKREQADLVWKTLFIDHSPVSEACRGVLTVLDRFGLDTASRDLNSYRKFFDALSADEHVDRVFELAGVDSVVMTNDPFDETERYTWQADPKIDERFKPALRLDSMLNEWESTEDFMREWGYNVSDYVDIKTCKEVRRFLINWIDNMNPVYIASSLPADFAFPDGSARSRLISECVLPIAEERGIPVALMIGVKRQVNSELKSAGDSVGAASLTSVERLCQLYPHNKFLITMLSRENQHELCVLARKFANLMIFGCWWFLNTPSLLEETTRMRLDLLGLSMIPQHSDSRVLDQLIYKWEHSKAVIGDALARQYENLAATGWNVTDEEIRRDVADLFGGNFSSFADR
jgi:hypothetical protein